MDIYMYIFALTCNILHQVACTVSNILGVKVQGPNYCFKPSCVSTAARILENLNTRVNPCEDFYEFACGSFRNHHSIPSGRSSFSAFSQRDILNGITLRSVLEETNNMTKYYTDRMAVVLYKACMNKTSRNEHGVEPLLSLLKQTSPWYALRANFNALNYSVYDHIRKIDAFYKGISSHAFFSLSVTVDIFNSSRYVFVLSQPSLSLVPDNYRKNHTKNLYALQVASGELGKILGFSLTSSEIKQVIDLETNIAKILVPEEEQRKPTSKMKGNLSVLMNDMNCSGFHWLEMIRSRLSQANVSYHFDANTDILIEDFMFFSKMCSLVSDYTKTADGKKVVNTLVLYRSAYPFLSYLTPDIEAIIRKLIATINGITGEQPPWERCVGTVSHLYGFPLGSLFVRALFDQDAKTSASQMIKHVKSAFSGNIERLQWMDAETRAAAMNKINNMTVFVGYPTYLLNDSFVEERWGNVNFSETNYFRNAIDIMQLENRHDLKQLPLPVEHEMEMLPQTINAYYQPTANLIAFTAAILQQPFFHPDLPAAVSYGGIGAVIGHEITHGFDDEGRKYDASGNLRRWWTSNTSEEFRSRAECVQKQYEKYSVEGIGIKGGLILGESIADCGGLKAAFHAYQNVSVQEEPLLPGINFTSKQLFFISYAQTWCDVETPEKRKESSESDPHPPSQMRVWGPVSNLEDFSEAFSCPIGSSMNPGTERCVVF